MSPSEKAEVERILRSVNSLRDARREMKNWKEEEFDYAGSRLEISFPIIHGPGHLQWPELLETIRHEILSGIQRREEAARSERLITHMASLETKLTEHSQKQENREVNRDAEQEKLMKRHRLQGAIGAVLVTLLAWALAEFL